jgi:hypothetical protein
MFTKPVKAIFHVLGHAFLSLAAMTEEEADRLEMTGTQYLNKLAHEDRPDVGKDIPVDTSKQAATVFGASGGGTSANAGQVVAIDFAALAVGGVHSTGHVDHSPATVVKSAPVYTMTELANGYTREQYHESKWTDADLIRDGYMTVTHTDESPNAQPAAASTTQTAISTQAIASTQDAPPAAPAATVAQPPAGGVTVDSTGLPWDARIHASTRTQNADGSWKKKKGTGDVFYNQVVAELRQATPAPAAVPFVPLTAAAPAPAAPAPAAPAPAAPAPAAPAPAAPAPAAPAPAAPAPAAPAPAADTPATFADLCRWVTANGFTVPDMLGYAKQFGVESAGILAQPANAALIPMVYDKMVAALK